MSKMQNNNSTVSVIMPCYNDGAYIEESIQSVLDQTYADIEIIVADDGSDDPATQEVLHKLEKSNICKIIRTNHSGPSGARNAGIKQATGKYILPLDSDDLIDKTYIQKAVAAIEEVPSRGVVYCYADLFGEATGRWDLPAYSFNQMLRDNIVFITALFYREDWVRVGGFKENMKHGMEDYDFWIGLLEIGREIYQIPEVLFHYRIKKKSRTTSLMNSPEYLKQMYNNIYDNHPEFYQKYQVEYAKELRATLIEQILLRQQLSQANEAYQRIKNIPFLRRLIKRIITKGK